MSLTKALTPSQIIIDLYELGHTCFTIREQAGITAKQLELFASDNFIESEVYLKLLALRNKNKEERDEILGSLYAGYNNVIENYANIRGI